MGEGVKVWVGVGVSEGSGVALTVGVGDAVAVAESVAETEGDWLAVAGGRVASSSTWVNWERRVASGDDPAGCRMAQAAKKRVRKRRLPAPTSHVGVTGKSLFVMTFFAGGRSRFGQISEEEGAIFAGADGVVTHGGREEGKGDGAKIYLVAAAV